MNRILVAIFLVVFACVSAACGALNPLTGGDSNLKRVSELWSDVPAMDGLGKPIEAELPPSIKLLMRTGVNLMMKGLGEGSPEWDWITFSTSKTPDDIKNFYTNARMAPHGWESDKSACFSGSEQAIAQGSVFCAFTKEQGNKQTGLLIIAVQDNQAKQTSAMFLRLEGTATPTPTKQANGKDTGGSKMVNAPVPYGINQRALPSGLNLDQLLPRQVGPYARQSVELATRRGVEATAIKMDGDSVYAQYRSGSGVIFVEFAVTSSAATAQSILQTAAGETTPQFPTDPRFGALGQEPSYFKTINADGAFFAWTRGGYYFSASSKNGEAALDAFMRAFPY